MRPKTRPQCASDSLHVLLPTSQTRVQLICQKAVDRDVACGDSSAPLVTKQSPSQIDGRQKQQPRVSGRNILVYIRACGYINARTSPTYFYYTSSPHINKPQLRFFYVTAHTIFLFHCRNKTAKNSICILYFYLQRNT